MRLLLAIFLSLPVFGLEEMLPNGDFCNGMTGWQFRPGQDFKSEVEPTIQRQDGEPIFMVDVPEKEPNNGVMLLHRIELAEGKTYMLTVTCRTEASGEVALRYSQIQKPWSPLGYSKAFEPTGGRMRYVATFNPRGESSENPSGRRINMGGSVGKVFLKNVSFFEVPDSEIPNKSG